MAEVKYKKQSSFSISITLPQPPEEYHIVSAFPQIHGKLDISPGTAAQQKKCTEKVTSIMSIIATPVPRSVWMF